MIDPGQSLSELRDRWDEAGRTDPFWAVLSQPDKSGIRENYEWKYASWEDRIFVPIATLARRLGISRDRAGRIYFGKPGSGLGYERARTRINTDFFSGVIVKPGSEEFEQLRRDLSTWQSSGSV